MVGENVFLAETARVKNSILDDYVRVKDYSEITNSKIGEYSAVSQFCVINKTVMQKFCSIGHGSYLGLWEHDTNVSTHSFYLYESSGGFVDGYKDYTQDEISTTIGNDVWIGANAVVLKGVNVGDGVIIGAGSVVTKDIPAYAVVVGNPAKVIKYRFNDEDIRFLLTVKWWGEPRDILQKMVDDEVFYDIGRLKDFYNQKGIN